MHLQRDDETAFNSIRNGVTLKLNVQQECYPGLAEMTGSDNNPGGDIDTGNGRGHSEGDSAGGGKRNSSNQKEGKGRRAGKGRGRQAKEGLLGEDHSHGMPLRRRKNAGTSQTEEDGGGPVGASSACKSRGATGLPRNSRSSKKQSDVALSEKSFYEATNAPSSPENSSEPESPALSLEAHHFVLELSLACHRFLNDSPQDDPDNPLKQVVRLLEANNSSRLAEAAAARLEFAFSQDSLESLAMRCSIAEENIMLNSFSFMLNTIQLRCKVIR